MTPTERLRAIEARIAAARQAECRRQEQIEQSRQARIAAADRLRSRLAVLNGAPWDDGSLRVESHDGTPAVALTVVNRHGHPGGGAYSLLTVTPQLEPGRPAAELDYRIVQPGDATRPRLDERCATEDAAVSRLLDVVEPLLHLPTLEGKDHP